MAQSLTAESNPRRQVSFKKASEQSSPMPPKGTQEDAKLLIDIRNSCIERKMPIGRLYPNPHINVTGISKEHIHSGLSASML